MAAYYAKAWNLWFTYRDDAVCRGIRRIWLRCERSTRRLRSCMAVRIRNFGGVIQELAPGASLDRDDMRLVFCRTASRLAYLAYVTRSLLHLPWSVPGIDLAHSTSVTANIERPLLQRESSAGFTSKLTGSCWARSRRKSRWCQMH